MDSVSLISSVVNARESATASERRMAVAANAVRTEQETVSVLMEAIQQSAAYGSNGQALSSSVGTRFAGVA
ncbi:MAG TPA: hypothetical protein VK163_11120 [Opitutaceae bacterium]|nr:hypothetical protein [Opitutaceae bacterium]